MKITLKLLLLLTAGISALAPKSFASGGAFNGGGGGQVIVCDFSPTAAAPELLDLFEWRRLHPDQPVMQGTGNLAKDVDAALVRLQNAFPARFHDYYNIDPADALQWMRDAAKPFLDANNPGILRRHGETIATTSDTYAVAWPKGCEPQQIVNYQPGDQIWINQDLYDQLPELDQAALIVHEVLYALLRNQDGESTSIRTRRAVGYVFSGQEFPPQPDNFGLDRSWKQFQCTTGPFPDFDNVLYFWIKEGKNEKGGSVSFALTYYKVDGSVLLGTPLPVAAIPLGSQAKFPLLLEKGCRAKTPDRTGGLYWTLEGPIEFDRTLTLSIGCEKKEGPAAVSLSYTTPGAFGKTKVPLSCRPTGK